MKAERIGLKRIGLQRIGLPRIGVMGAGASMKPTEIVGISYAREIGATPSAMANGTLTDQKWAKVSAIKGNSVVDGEQIISYQQWGESVVWNQLVVPDYEKINCKIEDNTIIRTAEGRMRVRTNNSDRLPQKLLEGHKYVASVKIKANSVGTILFGSFNSSLAARGGYHTSSNDCTKITQLSIFFTWAYTANYGFPQIGTQDNNITSIEFEDLYVVDLTQMFGAGNEPTTIEEFERRRPRNVSNEYNEGTEISGDISLVSVVNGTSTTTLLPNVSLIKDTDGNQLFPYGLCSAGSVYDEITETKAVKRIGVDMETLSHYELAEPIEVEINKWKVEYKVEQGGTEQIISENNTTNLKAEIMYGNKV